MKTVTKTHIKKIVPKKGTTQSGTLLACKPLALS